MWCGLKGITPTYCAAGLDNRNMRAIIELTIQLITSIVQSMFVPLRSERSSAMLTLLGKELRKLRLEHGELLKDMADCLSITPAYLSSIEHGKRVPPKDLVGKLQNAYSLPDEAYEDIWDAYHQTVEEVSLSLKTASPRQRDLGLAFARKFDGLSPEDIKKMMAILKREDG